MIAEYEGMNLTDRYIVWGERQNFVIMANQPTIQFVHKEMQASWSALCEIMVYLIISVCYIFRDVIFDDFVGKLGKACLLSIILIT